LRGRPRLFRTGALPPHRGGPGGPPDPPKRRAVFFFSSGQRDSFPYHQRGLIFRPGSGFRAFSSPEGTLAVRGAVVYSTKWGGRLITGFGVAVFLGGRFLSPFRYPWLKRFSKQGCVWANTNLPAPGARLWPARCFGGVGNPRIFSPGAGGVSISKHPAHGGGRPPVFVWLDWGGGERGPVGDHQLRLWPRGETFGPNTEKKQKWGLVFAWPEKFCRESGPGGLVGFEKAPAPTARGGSRLGPIWADRLGWRSRSWGRSFIFSWGGVWDQRGRGWHFFGLFRRSKRWLGVCFSRGAKCPFRKSVSGSLAPGFFFYGMNGRKNQGIRLMGGGTPLGIYWEVVSQKKGRVLRPFGQNPRGGGG